VVLVLLVVVVVVVSVLMVVMVLQDARVFEVDLFHLGILCKDSPDTEMYRLGRQQSIQGHREEVLYVVIAIAGRIASK
jgi:hypothetical protein